MKTLAAAVAIALAGTALSDGTPRGEARSPLPYFAGPDLTPVWLEKGEDIARLHRIGSFDLLDQTGARFSEADVAGRIHVASFLFTACAGICPQLVTRLGKVQDALAGADEALLLSFSVDPERDTPARLAVFGEERGIEPLRWRLLTGPLDAVYAAARGSYFADDADPAAGMDAFVHTERVLLVDADGRIRGAYNGTLPLDMDRLVEDIRLLRERS